MAAYKYCTAISYSRPIWICIQLPKKEKIHLDIVNKFVLKNPSIEIYL